jgi:hypothetical protein
VVWALVNLIVGYVLVRIGKVSSVGSLALVVFFAGIAALSTWLSVLFAKIKPAPIARAKQRAQTEPPGMSSNLVPTIKFSSGN